MLSFYQCTCFVHRRHYVQSLPNPMKIISGNRCWKGCFPVWNPRESTFIADQDPQLLWTCGHIWNVETSSCHKGTNHKIDASGVAKHKMLVEGSTSNIHLWGRQMFPDGCSPNTKVMPPGLFWYMVDPTTINYFLLWGTSFLLWGENKLVSGNNGCLRITVEVLSLMDR